ncbi:MAG: FHA domain-containing protein [Phycisphaerales bacterium]|nr:MAG: FHA domain-containing protein [Phycisphaerales bacterium]
MEPTRLTIRGGDKNWQVDLNPEGTLIGRSPACDVVINSREVSRRHARVFRAPSACWMIEDLGSSNSTFVNGKRVKTYPVLPGDIVGIGPASLSLDESFARQTDATVLLPGPNIIVTDFGTEVFYSTPRLEDCPVAPCPKRLDQVRRRLAELTDVMPMHAEACRAVTQGPKTAAVVLRISPKDRPLPKTPEVLTCCFGSSFEDTMAEPADEWDPSHHAFRVCHRLLDQVRTRGHALMAKSIFSCDPAVTVSLINEHSPRALMCAPLGETDDAVILLYLDVPIWDRAKPSTEEMFAFIQAVAREVRMLACRVLHDAKGE